MQVLERHSDVWGRGSESIDLRIRRAAYQKVSKYFPECSVVVEDVEALVQASEHRMFPARKADEDAWTKAVVEEICSPEQSNLAACEKKMEEVERKLQLEQEKSWFEEFVSG